MNKDYIDKHFSIGSQDIREAGPSTSSVAKFQTNFYNLRKRNSSQNDDKSQNSQGDNLKLISSTKTLAKKKHRIGPLKK